VVRGARARASKLIAGEVDPRFDRRMDPRFTDRPATAADHATFTRLLAELGVDDPPPSLEAWMADTAGTTRMLEAEGRVVGYGTSHLLGSIGFVSMIVIDPGERLRGAGRALMRCMAASFRALGCAEWALHVKVGNEPALRLYRSLGLEPQYWAKVFRLAWDDVARLPREDGTFALKAIEASEEAALEASFQLLPGRLAAQWRRAGRVQRQLVETRASGDVCVGVVSSASSFLHAAPFRMARPSLAPWLIDALRPFATPDNPSVGLVVEDDAALAEVIAAAGGEVRFEMLLLRGPLPQE
jgi:ribosomal protein S18 acetylase RimI-like enzyme